MAEVILMPRLSDTMTEGVIAAWHKNVGDTVKKGDLLAEIETDKATMELESYKDGILLYQGAKAGEKILVNELLCVIGAAGTNIDAIVAAVKSGAGATAPAASPAPSTPATTVVATPAPAAPAVQAVVNEGRIFASPLAKKMAEERGIDLKYVKGTGDNGRITKFDIDGYTPASASVAAAAPITGASASVAVQAAHQGVVSFEDQPVSQMRKTIARRLSESKFSAPEFYLTMEINMDKAIEARVSLNEVLPVKISFNDMVIKATALALTKHPKINALQSKVDILTVDKKLKANMLLPKIDLGYSYLSEPSYFDDYKFQDYKVGLNFAFPLFLRKERGSLKIAKFKVQDAQLELDLERVQLKNKINAQQIEITSLLKQEDIISDLVKDNNTMLTSEERLFSFGESSIFLINTRENNLVLSQLSKINVENRFFVSNAELFKIMANPE